MELALTAGAMLIDPRGQPECGTAASIGVGEDFVTGNTGDAGSIVSAKASANPELMRNIGVMTEQCDPVLDGGFQCFSLSAVDAVRERFHDDLAHSLQCDSPSVGSTCLMIYADDVTGRRHVEEAQRSN